MGVIREFQSCSAYGYDNGVCELHEYYNRVCELHGHYNGIYKPNVHYNGVCESRGYYDGFGSYLDVKMWFASYLDIITWFASYIAITVWFVGYTPEKVKIETNSDHNEIQGCRPQMTSRLSAVSECTFHAQPTLRPYWKMPFFSQVYCSPSGLQIHVDARGQLQWHFLIGCQQPHPQL